MVLHPKDQNQPHNYPQLKKKKRYLLSNCSSIKSSSLFIPFSLAPYTESVATYKLLTQLLLSLFFSTTISLVQTTILSHLNYFSTLSINLPILPLPPLFQMVIHSAAQETYFTDTYLPGNVYTLHSFNLLMASHFS